MKKIIPFAVASAFALLTANVLASSQSLAQRAHYGLPRPVVSETLGAATVVAFTFTNNNNDRYDVTIIQANGVRDDLTIKPVSQSSQNVISVDNPSWPVHVMVYTQPYTSGQQPFQDQKYYPDHPNGTVHSYDSIAHTYDSIAHSMSAAQNAGMTFKVSH